MVPTEKYEPARPHLSHPRQTRDISPGAKEKLRPSLHVVAWFLYFPDAVHRSILAKQPARFQNQSAAGIHHLDTHEFPQVFVRFSSLSPPTMARHLSQFYFHQVDLTRSQLL